MPACVTCAAPSLGAIAGGRSVASLATRRRWASRGRGRVQTETCLRGQGPRPRPELWGRLPSSSSSSRQGKGAEIEFGGARRSPPRVHTVPGWASQCYAFIRHLSAQCQPSGWHSVPSATPVPAWRLALNAQRHASAAARNLLRRSVPT